jgi:hypothetical protein
MDAWAKDLAAGALQQSNHCCDSKYLNSSSGHSVQPRQQRVYEG